MARIANTCQDCGNAKHEAIRGLIYVNMTSMPTKIMQMRKENFYASSSGMAKSMVRNILSTASTVTWIFCPNLYTLWVCSPTI